MLLASSLLQAHPLTIVLDPSCNTRAVATEYENNVAFLYCQSIQDYCEQHLTDHVIEITRSADEQLDEYGAAQFSNKLTPDVHISVTFTSTKRVPTVSIYYFTYAQTPTPTTSYNSNTCSFTPVWAAYQEQKLASVSYAQACYELLAARYGDSVTIRKPIGCPCKSLLGVTAPALMIEFDLEHLESSELFQEILLDVVEQLPHARADA